MSDPSVIDELFWHGLLRAVEAEPVGFNSILGGSGLRHTVVAAGIDPSRRRMVLVSGEADPNQAALALADLQATFRAIQILLIRLEPAVSPGDSTNQVDRGSHTLTAGKTDAGRGLCVIRTGDLSDTQIDDLRAGDQTRAQRVLSETGHLQYFFPPPDQLALALIERATFATIPQVIDQLVRAPDLGHPFSAPEIVDDFGTFTELIQDLQQLGLVSIGTNELTITEAGRASRLTIRDQPREALVDKLINRLYASREFKPIWLPVIRRHS
ncbi:MAG: hypothetical protein ABIP75_09620 [Pyrinomonadaceae bacterium]